MCFRISLVIIVEISLEYCSALPILDPKKRMFQIEKSWLSPGCKELWFENQVDHFNWGPTPFNISVWNQRYFLCDNAWRKSAEGGRPGPIFFYCGNEAPVDLYVNATGFMYETAPIFGAMLIFAEHRYYGQSVPFGNSSMQYLHYLTHEQVLRIFVNRENVLKELSLSSTGARRLCGAHL